MSEASKKKNWKWAITIVVVVCAGAFLIQLPAALLAGYCGWNILFYEDVYSYDDCLNDQYLHDYDKEKFHDFFETEIPEVNGYESVAYTYCDGMRAGFFPSFEYALSACTVTYTLSEEAYAIYADLPNQIPRYGGEAQYIGDGYLVFYGQCEIGDYDAYLIYEEDAVYPKDLKLLLMNGVKHTISFSYIYDDSLDIFSDEDRFAEYIALNADLK